MTNVSAEVRKLAADHYDEALAAGLFTIGGIVESLTDDLETRLSDGDESVTHGLIALAARSAVDAVDKSRTVEEQQSLFEALDQPIKLGEGERLARRHLTARGWTAHLGHIADNAARVNASAAKENRRFSALAPYLVGNTTTEEALAAWQADNPDTDLP